MAEIMQAKGGRGERRKLKRVIVEKAKGGGHIVEHHYEQSSGPMYHEPEKVAFSAGQGKEMLAHVGSKMGVKSEESTEDPKGPAMAAAPDSDSEEAEA